MTRSSQGIEPPENSGRFRARCDSGAVEADGTFCGNGVVDVGEICDDGNNASGDCCSPGCEAPVAVCASPGTSQLQIRDDANDAKDKVKWKWMKGTAALSAFGDPTSTTDYRLCVWDDDELVIDAAVEGGASCDGDPCWSSSSSGYSYRDRHGLRAGITAVKMRAGDLKASIQVAGAGAALPLPGEASPSEYFNLDTAVKVQLFRSDSSDCWQSSFVTARKNQPGVFQAKLP